MSTQSRHVNRPQPALLLRPVELAQYTSQQFTSLATEFGVRLSVGCTGQCWDNALAESFFATIKRELLDTRTWPSRAVARTAIFDFIEGLVQLAPTAQQPRLPQSRRIRDRARSLTTTPMVSVKAEQAQAPPLRQGRLGVSGVPCEGTTLMRPAVVRRVVRRALHAILQVAR
ncbi:integrase core domain-containing protein [Streptomyces europaeiscabiei]|uniref:integrase core domain-containing protein n=1 Tax=Streptomyces europaeiscabiei TaxID=146819 RepID=UPI0038D453AD